MLGEILRGWLLGSYHLEYQKLICGFLNGALGTSRRSLV